MSQEGILKGSGGSGGPPIETITGNSGGAVGPDAAFNINFVGNTTMGVTVVGNAGLNTLTIVPSQATTTQFGVIKTATNAQAIAGTDANNAVTSAALAAKLGTQTAFSVALFEGSSSALSPSNVGTNGQVLIGATGANPAFATLTSSDSSITFTTGVNSLSLQVTGGTTVGKTITGNSGGALSPTAGNWNILGSSVAAGTTPVATSGAASTLTVNVQTSQAIAAADATKIGLCNFDSSSFAVAATGFVTASGTGILKTLTGNSGGAISPTAGNINTLGTGSITISGAGSTLTTQLTGLTNHAVLVGAGTATITNIAATANTGAVLQNNSGADPSYSTATYPSTTTINQILYSSAANTVTGLATANRAVLTTGATGVPVLTALATDGQLIIGSTAGAPAAATLSAGTGISISNGSNSITISSSGGGLTWTVITADQTAAVGNGYICNKASALLLTLPATAAAGDIIRVTGINTALGWKIVQNANQQIFFGNQSTTLGATGFLQSAATRDSVEIVCVVAGASTVYNVISSIGNITVS